MQIDMSRRELTPFSRRYWYAASEGRTIRVADMETRHLFNCFRMVYDGLVLELGYMPERPPGKGMQAQVVADDFAAYLLASFAAEIIIRADLPIALEADFGRMLRTLGFDNTARLESAGPKSPHSAGRHALAPPESSPDDSDPLFEEPPW